MHTRLNEKAGREKPPRLWQERLASCNWWTQQANQLSVDVCGNEKDAGGQETTKLTE